MWFLEVMSTTSWEWCVTERQASLVADGPCLSATRSFVGGRACAATQALHTDMPTLVKRSALAVVRFLIIFEQEALHWALRIREPVLLTPLWLCTHCSLPGMLFPPLQPGESLVSLSFLPFLLFSLVFLFFCK